MKTYGRMEIALLFLISAQNGGNWSASRPCHITSRETASGIQFIGGSMSPRIGLEVTEEREIFYRYR
jgi:hypothetical protein